MNTNRTTGTGAACPCHPVILTHRDRMARDDDHAADYFDAFVDTDTDALSGRALAHGGL